MARTNGKGAQEQAPLTSAVVRKDRLFPNPWNVNEMDQAMFQKELASIGEFGFVDPILARPHPWEKDAYQIIDGEHRWRAGVELGMEEFPVSIIDVDDETAQQLSIVLNETRGSSNPVKLASLVRSLAQKRDPERLQQILPFSRERFAAMISGQHGDVLDFDALRQKREAMKGDQATGWVERVFRMPSDSATVVDDAIKQIMDNEQIDQDWRALEMMAADFLAGE